jgi:hypothetical protein
MGGRLSYVCSVRMYVCNVITYVCMYVMYVCITLCMYLSMIDLFMYVCTIMHVSKYD